MDFDLYTLSSIYGITCILLVIPFVIQYIINRSREAVGWWTLGMVATSLGFITNSLRQIPDLAIFAIYANNLFFLFAYIFIYLGIFRFFGKKIKIHYFAILALLFLIGIFYFTNIYDSLIIRRLISSIAFALLSIINLTALLKNKRKTNKFSILFLVVIFGIIAVFFILRACIYAFNPPPGDVFTSNPIEVTLYIVIISTTILWTFGLILLLNQSLQAQITEDNINLELIFDTSPDAILITKVESGEFVKSNTAFSQLFGYESGEIKGKTILGINIYQNPDDRKSLLADLKKNGTCKNKEFIFRRKDGSFLIGAMSANFITLNGIPHIISITRDITEQKTLENQLIFQARTDILTGITNRRYFYELAENEIKRSLRYKSPLSMVLIDIDLFKQINDTYGHLVGDEILKFFAETCQSIIRESDIFARIGGDEFVLLLPETTIDQTKELMHRIYLAFESNKYPLPEENIEIHISAGISSLFTGDDINKLMNRSDNALFAAKNAGRNQFSVEG